jgi:hypothetical protein
MPPSSQLPNFLILGAAKAGTTSLHSYLKTHPGIYLSPIKEPLYFAFPETRPVFTGPNSKRRNQDPTIIWKIEDYRRLFAGRTSEPAAGEVSPQYLYRECSPGAIRKLIPEAKLIAILRDPADRAYSHFCHSRRDGREPLSDFAEALAAEDKRIAAGWWFNFHYRNRGYYAKQLKRYLELFPREQILVLLYDDMVSDCQGLLRRICAFLGVDENHGFDTTERHNVTIGIPRSLFLDRFLNSTGPAKRLIRRIVPADVRLSTFHRLNALNLAPQPAFDPSVRRQLVSAFKPDILELEQLIDRDLSAWLRC